MESILSYTVLRNIWKQEEARHKNQLKDSNRKKTEEKCDHFHFWNSKNI